MEKKLGRILIAAALILAAVLSFTFAADKAASQQAHAEQIEKIDSKIDAVLKLSAASTLASVGVSALHDDTATPIAEKLADLTNYFLIVLCVLYTEKYLLTIVGVAAFRILIPAACLLFTVCLFRKSRLTGSLGIKFAVLAIALYLAIPIGLGASDMVYSAYQTSIENTLASAQDLTEKTEEVSRAGNDEGLLASVWERISETASSLARKASNILNRFIETIAVFLVVTCIIPVLTLLLMLWMIKTISGFGAAAVFPAAEGGAKGPDPDTDG